MWHTVTCCNDNLKGIFPAESHSVYIIPDSISRHQSNETEVIFISASLHDLQSVLLLNLRVIIV